jgi:hypothetical protein
LVGRHATLDSESPASRTTFALFLPPLSVSAVFCHSILLSSNSPSFAVAMANEFANKSYYEILGVPDNASQDQIKKGGFRNFKTMQSFLLLGVVSCFL